MALVPKIANSKVGFAATDVGKTWPKAFSEDGNEMYSAAAIDSRIMPQEQEFGYVWTKTLYGHPPKNGVFVKGQDLVSVVHYEPGKRLVLPARYIPDEAIGIEGAALVILPKDLEMNEDRITVIPKSIKVIKNAVRSSGAGKIDRESGVPISIPSGESPPISQQRRLFIDEGNYDLAPVARYNYGHEKGDVVALYWCDRVMAIDYRAGNQTQQATILYHPSASLPKDEIRKLKNIVRDVGRKADELAVAVKTVAQKVTGAPRLTPTDKVLTWISAIASESVDRKLPSAKEADAPAMTQEDISGSIWTRTLLSNPPRNGSFKPGMNIVSLHPAHDDKMLVMPAQYVPQEAIGRVGVMLIIDPERLEYGEKFITVIPRSVSVLKNPIQVSGQVGILDDETGVSIVPRRADIVGDGKRRRLLFDDSNYNITPIVRYFCQGRRDIIDACSWPSREIEVTYVERKRQLSPDDLSSLVAEPTARASELLRVVDALTSKLEEKFPSNRNGNDSRQRAREVGGD